MKCKTCGLEAAIVRTELKLQNDDTPERETKVYKELVFACRNGRCPEHGKEVGSVIHQLK